MLEVSDLVTAYGKIEALKGVSLRAEAGRITCLLGPNGAGKTTLMMSIAGVLKTQRGTIRLEGHDVPVRAVRLTEAEAEAFFRNELRTYVDALPWLWRRVASVFGGEPLRNPARAARRHRG